ncbi:MAG: hypothetical protein HZA16_02240 [Nitrospirae bacterium]|nr:hypothetical protein [Nitrospirota bacterium]
MKKVLIGIAAAIVLAVAALAVAAHDHGDVKGGHMMMQGCGGHMTGPMTGMCGQTSDPKFLDETRELRKGLHDKRFEYSEAVRNPETSQEYLTKLEKDMADLREQISVKLPQDARGNCAGCNCR